MATKTKELVIESNMNDKKQDSTTVDLKALLSDCMNKQDLLEELVLLFKKNIEEFIQNTQKHIVNVDVTGIAFTSHKIKSSLKMMRAHDLIKIAEQMNSVCKNEKDVSHIKFLFNQFLEQYPNTEKSIDDQLKKLKEN